MVITNSRQWGEFYVIDMRTGQMVLLPEVVLNLLAPMYTEIAYLNDKVEELQDKLKRLEFPVQ